MIFVDGGSIHNFIQSSVMKYLNLPSSPKLWLQVMVGNITNMECNTTSYSQVPIDIQGHHFTLGLFALPLNGADLVLGVQWLKELGPLPWTIILSPCLLHIWATPLSSKLTSHYKPLSLVLVVPHTRPGPTLHSFNAQFWLLWAITQIIAFFNYLFGHAVEYPPKS